MDKPNLYATGDDSIANNKLFEINSANSSELIGSGPNILEMEQLYPDSIKSVPNFKKPKIFEVEAQRLKVENLKTKSSKRNRQINYRHYLHFFVGLFAIVIGCFWFLNAFMWGLVIGILGTIGVRVMYNFLFNHSTGLAIDLCPISGLPLNEFCCSVHWGPEHLQIGGGELWWPIYAPAMPHYRQSKRMQFRDLPNLTIPQIMDENVNHKVKGRNDLKNNLGFKLDKNDCPLYYGWMNEINVYNPDTHHINKTYSVFITLDGTQLKLQRPERNITRRSLWNDEIPPLSSTHFKSERNFELVHARVTLVPVGLVGKRLWSRKYPICITIPAPYLIKSDCAKHKNSTTLSNSSSYPTMPNFSNLGSSAPDVNLLASNLVVDSSSSLHHNGPTLSPNNGEHILYLFGRTSREKETWYQRLHASSLGVPLVWTPQLAVQNYLLTSTNPTGLAKRLSSTHEMESDDEDEIHPDANGSNSPVRTAPTNYVMVAGNREPLYVTYTRYMAKFMPADWLVRSSQALKLNVNRIGCDPNLIWINSLIGRVLWDFLREPYWLDRIRNKIQAKLRKLHLPYFIKELTVVDIDLGSEVPVVRHVGLPYLDANGLWIEVDMAYAGGFTFSLETNVNLMRWNQKNREEIISPLDQSMSSDSNQGVHTRSTKMAAFISDEEDSVDSTTDSDLEDTANHQAGSHFRSNKMASRVSNANGSQTIESKHLDVDRPYVEDSPSLLSAGFPSRRRFIRIVDRITKSTYFQKAVDTKIVQRGMERLSNTPIVLQVEIQLLAGTLLLNIPPPPSDRLWYGFRPTPQLRLKARPRVGEKMVTMSRILEWIEKKLILEFQHLVVLPNMDDLKIDLLLSGVST